MTGALLSSEPGQRRKTASIQKTPAIHRWLLRHPRFTFHFTPTYSSWLNLVERWFAELTECWLRRGSHYSTKDLVASTRTWITGWNEDPRPFVWHRTADEILHTLASWCERISDSGHRAWAAFGAPRLIVPRCFAAHNRVLCAPRSHHLTGGFRSMAMELTLDSVCALSDDVVAQEIEGEITIVPLSIGVDDGEMYTLNDTGREVWRLLDGQITLRQAVAVIVGEFDAPPLEIQADVLGFATEIARLGFLAVRA